MSDKAVIVAHPDDETLWTGGLILEQANADWFIASLCRKSDLDRAPKFNRVLQEYGAQGAMGDLDDGPDQDPLPDEVVQRMVLELLPNKGYDLIVTHGPSGEYTRHHRHEEVSRAVINLWQAGSISAKELWLCAFEDDGGRRMPRAIESAHCFMALPETIQGQKFRLITEVYGFDPRSWEAQAVPHNEAFWRFQTPKALLTWLEESRIGQIVEKQTI
jgi:LmbE family N-acetylglucosaminyl deacetylase